MTTNTKPVDHIRFGRISAAIWKNAGDQGKVFYSFTIERNYSDKDGNFQSTNSFSLQDALTVAKIADLAHTRIHELLQADKAAADNQNEAA